MERYLKGYYNLINKCKASSRQKGERYYELHHIIPKSFGGSDLEDNLVLLTPKEHYIAHYLLTKFTKGKLKQKAAFAFYCMNNGFSKKESFAPRLYEKAKREFINLQSTNNKGESNPMYGKGYKISGKQNGRHHLNYDYDNSIVGQNISKSLKNRSEEEKQESICKMVRSFDEVEDNGLRKIQNIAKKAWNTKKNTILPNGLTLAEQQIQNLIDKRDMKDIIEKGKITRYSTEKLIFIQIFDPDQNLVVQGLKKNLNVKKNRNNLPSHLLNEGVFNHESLINEKTNNNGLGKIQKLSIYNGYYTIYSKMTQKEYDEHFES